MPPKIERYWAKILSLGDISGKLMTLIALPSAVFTVIIFFNEIGDSLSRPDVIAEIHNIGLRCGPYIDGKPALGETRNAFEIRKCYEASLSAWVKLDLDNQDTIDRRLASIALRITFPDELSLTSHPVIWNETRIVYHIIEDDKQTSQRWPWQSMALAAGQRMPLELDFRPFESEYQIPFLAFKQLIESNPSPLADAKIDIELLGWFSGDEQWHVLGHCQMHFPAASLAIKRDAKIIRALTRRCI